MEITLGALASLLGADLTDPERSDVKVSNIASIAEAGPDDLAFLWDTKFRDQATRCRAGALVTGEAIEGQACLVVADPEAALLAILGRVYDERCPPIEAGVHETAFVAGSASLGEGAAIGPQAVVEAGAVIGARAQIRGRAYVGRGVAIGADTTIHPNATILDGVRIGARVTIWSGAVIGKDGFGFLARGGAHVRIPQIGGVIIEDDVEIGALSTVARGAIGNTIVRSGVKIDDHCHVAHNCDIGEHTILVGRSVMGGSVTIGKNCYMLQDAGVSTGLRVGDGAMIGSCARVFYKDVPPGGRVSIPANTHHPVLTKRIELTLPRLPEMQRRLDRIERALAGAENGGPDSPACADDGGKPRRC